MVPAPGLVPFVCSKLNLALQIFGTSVESLHNQTAFLMEKNRWNKNHPTKWMSCEFLDVLQNLKGNVSS